MRARFRTFTCAPIKIVTELIMGLFSTNLHKPCTPSNGKSDLDAAESTLYLGIQRRDIRWKVSVNHYAGSSARVFSFGKCYSPSVPYKPSISKLNLQHMQRTPTIKA